MTSSDRDFLQQRDEDPNTTLTSVSDFPASASGMVLICYSGGSLVCSYSTGFIVNVQNDLESGFQGRNRTLFKTVAGPTLAGANALPPPFEYGCASRHIHHPVELAMTQLLCPGQDRHSRVQDKRNGTSLGTPTPS